MIRLLVLFFCNTFTFAEFSLDGNQHKCWYRSFQKLQQKKQEAALARRFDASMGLFGSRKRKGSSAPAPAPAPASTSLALAGVANARKASQVRADELAAINELLKAQASGTSTAEALRKKREKEDAAGTRKVNNEEAARVARERAVRAAALAEINSNIKKYNDVVAKSKMKAASHLALEKQAQRSSSPQLGADAGLERGLSRRWARFTKLAPSASKQSLLRRSASRLVFGTADHGGPFVAQQWLRSRTTRKQTAAGRHTTPDDSFLRRTNTSPESSITTLDDSFLRRSNTSPASSFDGKRSSATRARIFMRPFGRASSRRDAAAMPRPTVV